jgi:antitoxin component of MazEF toxin-antitoxin module
MRASIISIGNSKGIRIPKIMLKESGIEKEVDLKVSKGLLKIIPIKTRTNSSNETTLLSEKTLKKEWDRPEEDEAWANL